MVDTDDTRQTTDAGQYHGYGISSPSELKIEQEFAIIDLL